MQLTIFIKMYQDVLVELNLFSCHREGWIQEAGRNVGISRKFRAIFAEYARRTNKVPIVAAFQLSIPIQTMLEYGQRRLVHSHTPTNATPYRGLGMKWAQQIVYTIQMRNTQTLIRKRLRHADNLLPTLFLAFRIRLCMVAWSKIRLCMDISNFRRTIHSKTDHIILYRNFCNIQWILFTTLNLYISRCIDGSKRTHMNVWVTFGWVLVRRCCWFCTMAWSDTCWQTCTQLSLFTASQQKIDFHEQDEKRERDRGRLAIVVVSFFTINAALNMPMICSNKAFSFIQSNRCSWRRCIHARVGCEKKAHCIYAFWNIPMLADVRNKLSTSIVG